MEKFYYDEAGRKAVKEFLSKTSKVTVSKAGDFHCQVILTDDNGNQCEISQIVYDSLVQKNVISRI